jgi:hypothetical protein
MATIIVEFETENEEVVVEDILDHANRYMMGKPAYIENQAVIIDVERQTITFLVEENSGYDMVNVCRIIVNRMAK